MTKRIVVGISGASGVIYGVRLLEVLKDLGVETHLVMSPAAKMTIVAETKYTVDSVEKAERPRCTSLVILRLPSPLALSKQTEW